MFDYIFFTDKLLNNQLNTFIDIDQKLSGKNINNILNELKNIQGDKFNLIDVINKIILDSSIYFPLICYSFLKCYFFDQNVFWQAIKNIYLNSYKNKDSIDADDKQLLIDIISLIKDNIKIFYRLKIDILSMIKYQCKKNSIKGKFIPNRQYLITKKSLSVQEITQLLLVIDKIYWKLEPSVQSKLYIIDIFIVLFNKNKDILTPNKINLFLNIINKLINYDKNLVGKYNGKMLQEFIDIINN